MHRSGWKTALAALLMQTCLFAGTAFASESRDDAPAAAASLLRGVQNALVNGKVLFDTRLRYEFVSQGGVSNANAATARIRLGYQTAFWHGFAVLVEAEATGGINQAHNYRVPGLPDTPQDKAVVADPDNAEINRANLRYANEDLGIRGNLYRQRMILGDSRWVGNVGWRQNEQTFDAARIDLTPANVLPGLEAMYAYIWQTNRIFGLWSGRDVAGDAAGKWISGSHIVNVAWNDLGPLDITLYYYGFDNRSPDPLGSNSNNIGFHAAGRHGVGEDVELHYRAEYNRQISGFENPNDYAANYFHVTGGTRWKSLRLTAALENLGADGGFAVQSPYGTNHKFNGWADLFLATPTFGNTDGRAAGLRDLYIVLGTDLPLNIPAAVVYHKFWSIEGPVGDLGNEIDLSLSRKLGQHLTLLAKAAFYWGAGSGDAPLPVKPDTSKFWLQATWRF